MKNKKIFLDIFDEETLQVGLIRMAKKIPEHEMFFEINRHNTFCFNRIEDLKWGCADNEFSFSRYEAHHPEFQTCYHIIANRSFPNRRRENQNELFGDTSEVSYLMPKNTDVDYVFHAKESFNDFSVILLPENIFFRTQEFTLSPKSSLYQLLQYYE